MDILTAYYRQLLGQTFLPTWNFSLTNLYPHPVLGLTSLIQLFTENEFTDAFFQMNTYASHGPDGFGPGFYKKYWQTIEHKICKLFNQFYSQTADVSPINRAYLVLQVATAPEAFKPIYLSTKLPNQSNSQSTY
jgi:hypothetical protein